LRLLFGQAKMKRDFSFIILTYNEELHLPRLLASIQILNAPLFILDSGSTDQTLNIAQQYKATIHHHAFENHPKQWDYALKHFDIQTPWVIGLDADHIVSPELLQHLELFNDADYRSVDGIYFNRKNYFKGRWIKYGGYYPKYMLKMFRPNKGFSDLNENMDHRFIVPGNTLVWKNGHLIEENLKENEISFWISKHNRYSDLVAEEEFERRLQLRGQTQKGKFFGDPNERVNFLKQIWWKCPLYLRPFLYFSYRMIFKLGFLDGRTGIIFHFLQAFWYRLLIDIKIDEKIKLHNKNGIQ